MVTHSRSHTDLHVALELLGHGGVDQLGEVSVDTQQGLDVGNIISVYWRRTLDVELGCGDTAADQSKISS